MAVTLVMANQGWIPFELAAAMVLGENIGTTITANLAAIVANVYAKRAARAHFVFNVAGVLWMLVVFVPVIHGIDKYMSLAMGVSPLVQASAIPIGLAIFHTTFNIANTVIMVGLTPKIADLVTRMVPSKGDDEEFHLEFMARNIFPTPEISIMEARKEVAKFASVTINMSGFAHRLITKKDEKSRKKLMDRMKKYESITDRMEIEISNFLSKVAEGNISEDSSRKIRSLLSNANDLERIGDLFYQVALVIERQLERGDWFQKEQLKSLDRIYSLLNQSMQIMQENLSSNSDEIDLIAAMQKERELNAVRNELRRDYLKKVETGEYDVKDSMRYIELVNAAEKIGDHVINVSETLSGQVLSK